MGGDCALKGGGCTNSQGEKYSYCDIKTCCGLQESNVCYCCSDYTDAATIHGAENKKLNNSFSTIEMAQKKKGLVYAELELIEPLVKIDIRFPDNRVYKEDGTELQLYEGATKYDLRLLFTKAEKWKLSKTEKISLLNTLLAGIMQVNNLNLTYNVKCQLSKINLTVDTTIITTYTNINLQSCLTKLLCYAQFGSELENYNFSQLFNLLYNYLLLTNSYFKSLTILLSIGMIKRSYGLQD